MEQHAFHAMGTTFELVVEADEADAFAEAEAEVERLEQIMSRFRPDSELSSLNRDGTIDASPDLAEVVELALAARAADGRPVRPDHPRRPCRRRVRPDVRRGRGTTPIRPRSPPRCGGRGRPSPAGGSSSQPGVKLDLGGIGKGFAAERVAERLALTGPSLVSAGGDVAVRGVPTEGTWAVAVDETLTLGLTRGGLATSGRDRRRWRRDGRRAAPPDRSRNRPPVGDRHRAHDGASAPTRSTPRSSRRRSSSAVPTTHSPRRPGGPRDRRRSHLAGRRARLMHHDPTFWLIARAAGLTAYAVLTMSVLAGLVLKSRPFAASGPLTVAEIHKTLALTGLGALALHGVALVLDATVKVSPGAARRARTRHLPPRGRRRRRDRRLALRPDHRVVLAAQADRHARVAPPALAHLRPLRPRHHPRRHRRHRHVAALGTRPLPRRRRRRRRRHRVARTRSPRPPGGPERRVT